MDIVLLIAAFVGGCFAGGFINHWMISSGVSAGLSSLEVKIGNLQTVVASKIKPAPAVKS